jgi:hypothetical protein
MMFLEFVDLFAGRGQILMPHSEYLHALFVYHRRHLLFLLWQSTSVAE